MEAPAPPPSSPRAEVGFALKTRVEYSGSYGCSRSQAARSLGMELELEVAPGRARMVLSGDDHTQVWSRGASGLEEASEYSDGARVELVGSAREVGEGWEVAFDGWSLVCGFERVRVTRGGGEVGETGAWVCVSREGGPPGIFGVLSGEAIPFASGLVLEVDGDFGVRRITRVEPMW